MKKVILFLAATTLVACASHNSNDFSTDTNRFRLGEKPQDYPRTYLAKSDGNCTFVTEDWRKNGLYNGKQMWALDKHVKSVICQ
jgi:hypothetical protein